MAKSTRLRKVLRFLVIGSLISTVSLACLAISAVAFVKQAISRIEIDPVAFGKAMQEAVLMTLRDGPKEQKLQLISSFETASPAAPYIPLLAEATKDTDPEVSQAASKAIERINAAGAPK
jgi:hypothetical protein